MNLSLIAWGCPDVDQTSVGAQLRNLGRVYPQLDASTLFCEQDPAGGWLVASLRTGELESAPRQYLACTASHLTLFDGLPVDPHNTLKAHLACELDRNWERLPDVLEGKYLAARIARGTPAQLEVVNDPLGIAQLYYRQRPDGGWLLSNNVQLIRCLSNVGTPDALGVSLYLAMGWTGGDRTLLENIRVMPGGQCWKWVQGSPSPQKHSYFEPGQLVGSKPIPSSVKAPKLLSDLTPMFQTLAENFGTLRCLLTGGHDSRLIALLAEAAQAPVRFVTGGHPLSTDVIIAGQVARKLNRPHDVFSVTSDDLATYWQPVARQLVDQNDGLVSLWQIQDGLGQAAHPSDLPIILSGLGGAMARDCYGASHLRRFVQTYAWSDVRKILAKKFTGNYQDLIAPETTKATQVYLDGFIRASADVGFSPDDVPYVFHAWEEIRRWVGSNSRKAAPVGDWFTPYCTRAYLGASLTMSNAERLLETLQYQLMYLLRPDVHALPFTSRPWPPQSIPGYVRGRVGGGISRRLSRKLRRAPANPEVKVPARPAFDQASLLEVKREYLRDYCLAWPSSDLWRFVNRSTFERVMSAGVEPAARRSRLRGLYLAITLFHYFHPTSG